MKNISFLIFVFFFASISVVFTSCKKKKSQVEEVAPEPEPTPEPPYVKSFTSSNDGVDFTATTISGLDNQGYLIISGKITGTTIQFCTSTANDPGNYSVISALSLVIDNNTTFNCQSGTVEILTHDKVKKQISGNFSLNTKSSSNVVKTITNGKFATTY